MRGMIQKILLDWGKRIFYWPFDFNSYLIDFSLKKKTASENSKEGSQKDEALSDFIKRLDGSDK